MKFVKSICLVAIAGSLAQCEPHVNNVNVPNPAGENKTEVEQAPQAEKKELSQLKVSFGAFKTTDKVRVNGWFESFELSGVDATKEGLEKYGQAAIAIDVNSLSTGNPGRDSTLLEAFFGKTSSNESIEGKVKSLNESEGTASIEITFNGTTADLPFVIEKEGSKVLFKGVLEISDFEASDALDSINEACKGLHTGADGVSKTWNDVDLVIELQ